MIYNEAPISILDTPYQHLHSIILQTHARARTRAAEGTRSHNCELFEIDAVATCAKVQKFDMSELSYLHTVQSVSDWSKKEFFGIGIKANSTCDYCGGTHDDTIDLVWTCPQFSQVRTEIDPQLASIPFDMFGKHVLRGIAPAMTYKPETTFWGTEIPDELDPSQAKLLGARPLPEADGVEDFIAKARHTRCNARQLVACDRGGHGEGGGGECMPISYRRRGE